jgi:Zn-dependent M28 family amino/carboxypeptidase
VIPGSDASLRGEYVSITAHNDHIGYRHVVVDHDSLRAFNTVVRPLGADSPNRPALPAETVRIRRILDSLRALRPPRPDSINNGADDDGSGTVALIEIAQAMMRSGARPRRSILFVSHTAEEKGLLGSAWYTDHATVPIDSIVAEIDVDMIGRGAATDIAAGGPTYLEVVGLRRLSNELGDWFEAVNAREPLPFVFNYEYDAPGHPEQYYCRADHYSYARYGIPSVSLSRGSHMDYHQVTDEPQYIDYPDYARLTKLVYDAALFIADADHAPRLSVSKPTNPHVPCRQ